MSENLSLDAMVAGLPSEVRAAAVQVAQLLARVQPATSSVVLNMLPPSALHDACVLTLRQAGWQVACLPHDAAQAVVAHVVKQAQPAVVLCDIDVFGWVSKLAFLGGSAAIYTWSAEGEGTLLDRARHYSGVLADAPAAAVPGTWVHYDAHGVLHPHS